ncbi:MAG: 50S ribosomal protein L5, partial [Planctomycetia bacterium]
MAARLKQKYLKEIKPKLKSQFGLTNDLEIPRLTKIVINMGVGSAVENKTRVDAAVKNLTQISGQKPVVRKARKAISTFKLREGMPIGCSVTLR